MSEKVREMICIMCPMGCHLTVKQNGDAVETGDVLIEIEKEQED